MKFLSVKYPQGKLWFVVGLLLPLLCQSCFTGIESTPKITYKDVRRENIQANPDDLFAGQFVAVPYADWKPGRRFMVADGKASITFMPQVGKSTGVTTGDILIYCGARGVPSIVGGNTAELLFVKLPLLTDTLVYRPGMSIEALGVRGKMRLPFVVDLNSVADVARILAGRELFTRTDRWLAADGRGEVRGRKFVKVRVDSVLAGNENYPFAVCFTSLEKQGETGALMMSNTVTDGTPALRGFSNLFTLSDPRDFYPQITDANWELIRQGKLALGMTSQEATLSLGTPRDIYRRPDQSILYERWSYPGGVYLIFEDGLLTRFQQ